LLLALAGTAVGGKKGKETLITAPANKKEEKK